MVRDAGAVIQISKKGVYAPGTKNRIVTISGIPPSVNLPLKGLCHEIENGYHWYQKADHKNLVLPEHIFNLFQCLFMF
jgi:hypothetical protein